MACEYQKDIKFDEIQIGDLILVELFDEDGWYMGDRRGTAKHLEAGVWYFEDMPPVYLYAIGYRMFKVTVMDEAELERVLPVAENSESSDATRLAAEVRRLRKIEDGLENLIAMRKQVVDNLRAEATEWDEMGAWQSARLNRDTADKLMGEVWPLEALLNGE